MLLAFVLPACAAAQRHRRSHRQPRHRDATEQLRRDLGALFDGGCARPRAVGRERRFAARRRKTLYALNPSRFLVPASNQKLLTAAVAAERLGWDFRFTTRLSRPRPSRPDGSSTATSIVCRATAIRRSIRDTRALERVRRLGGGAEGQGIKRDPRPPHRRRQRVRRAGLGCRLGVGQPAVRLRRAGERAAIQREPGRGPGRAGHDRRRDAVIVARRRPAADSIVENAV